MMEDMRRTFQIDSKGVTFSDLEDSDEEYIDIDGQFALEGLEYDDEDLDSEEEGETETERREDGSTTQAEEVNNASSKAADWECENCTLINLSENTLLGTEVVQACRVCLKIRNTDMWECERCTTHNPVGLEYCQICHFMLHMEKIERQRGSRKRSSSTLNDAIMKAYKKRSRSRRKPHIMRDVSLCTVSAAHRTGTAARDHNTQEGEDVVDVVRNGQNELFESQLQEMHLATNWFWSKFPAVMKEVEREIEKKK